MPEYDPTPYIEAKMQKLNQSEPDEDEDLDDIERVHADTDRTRYLVNVVEGVR